MTTRFRRAAGLILAVALAVPTGTAAARPRPAPAEDDEARIVHALNRLTFGPRPGDVEAVRRIGLEEWISRQLHPERRDGKLWHAYWHCLIRARKPE